MKRYTIGIYFQENEDQPSVLLIKKVKPEWQKGLYNYPGGKIEDGESPFDCIAREFKEETDLNTTAREWEHIGRIEGNGYIVDVMTAISKPEHGIVEDQTEELLEWFAIDSFPENIISNLHWLREFAYNYHNQGLNGQDFLKFGTFKYDNVE